MSSKDSKSKDTRDKSKDRSRKGSPAKRSKKAKEVDDGDRKSLYCIDAPAPARSKCKHCKYAIPKEDARIGVRYESKDPKEDQLPWKWHHVRCMDPGAFLHFDVGSLDGYKDLTANQKRVIDDIASKKRRRAQCRIAKKDEDKDDDLDYYDWTTAKLKTELEKRKMWVDDKLMGVFPRSKKHQLALYLEKDDYVGGSGESMKNPPPPPPTKKKHRRGRSSSITTKKRKKSKKEDDDQSPPRRKAKLEDSPDYLNLKKLKHDLNQKNVDELKEMLKLNDQRTTGNKKELLDRVADGMAYGALPRCSTCNLAVLRVKYKTKYGHRGQGNFKCPGYFQNDDLKTCPYTSKSETRPAWKSKD